MKHFAFILVLLVALGLTQAVASRSGYSMQFIDRIVRPCSAGAVPLASVIVNPSGNGNINVIPCTGGSLTVNGVAVGSGTVGGTGTLNTFPIWTAASTLGNSTLTSDGGGLGLFYTKSGGATPAIKTRYSNGTIALPTKTLSGDVFGIFQFAGYDDGFAAYRTAADIRAIALENFAGAGAGAALTFNTIAVGGVNPVLRLQVDATGLQLKTNAAPGTPVAGYGALWIDLTTKALNLKDDAGLVTTFGAGTVGGTGTLNTLAKFTAASTLGNSNLIENGSTIAATLPFSITEVIGATSTDGFILSNTNPATVGAQKWSPRLRLTGSGWGTTAPAAQAVEWIVENQPVQGLVPTSNLIFSYSINGGAYAARATLSSAGGLTLIGSIAAVGGTFSGNVGGADFIAATGNSYTWSGTKSRIYSFADGNITIYNNGATGFSLLQLGGLTASFPAIKRNATAINFRLADDSGDAPITSGAITSSGAIAAGGNITLPAANGFSWVGRSVLASDADGRITLSVQALGDFSRLNFGGNTSSFPSIKRNLTAINFRLADDSGDAPITSDIHTVSKAIAATSTDGLILSNPTAATVGAQMWSPRLRLTGSGWGTTAPAAQAVDWIIENIPIQGTTPTSNLRVSYQANGGGYNRLVDFRSAGISGANASINVGTTDNNGIGICNGNQGTVAIFGAGTQVACSVGGGGLSISGTGGGGFLASGGNFASIDVALSRQGAGVWQIGTAQGNALGDLTLKHVLANGTAPVIASGFGASPTIAGRDEVFRVTVSTAPGTGGVVTFGTAYANVPVCSAMDETTLTVIFTTTPTASNVTITAAAGVLLSGDKIGVICRGYL